MLFRSVEKLRRVKIGPLELDQPPGRYRHLTNPEVAKLRRAVGAEQADQ